MPGLTYKAVSEETFFWVMAKIPEFLKHSTPVPSHFGLFQNLSTEAPTPYHTFTELAGKTGETTLAFPLPAEISSSEIRQ